MREFILNLYSNEGFPIYLGCVIIILVAAFIAVFLIGKKDKEEPKLDKIKENPDNKKQVQQVVNTTNNNENTIVENAQTPLINEPFKKENIEKLKPLDFEKKENVKLDKDNILKFEASSNQIVFPQTPKYTENETLDKTQVLPIFDAYDNDNPKEEPKSLENELLDSISSDLDELESDDFDNDDIKEDIILPKKKDGKTKVYNNVYSSVYIPKEEDKDSAFDKTMAIELPRIKGSTTLDEKGEDPFNL